MKQGHIIWLNGVSSSGKSTLANALQKQLQEPYFCIGQDIFTDQIAPCLSGAYNGIDGETLWYLAVDAMYHTIKTYADLGLNVIVDHVILNQENQREQRLFDACRKELANYPITYVKVTCSLDELAKRELLRGDRESGTAEWQMKTGLYPSDGYDVEVNTGSVPLDECAQKVIECQAHRLENTKEIQYCLLTPERIDQVLEFWKHLTGVHLHTNGEETYEAVKQYLERNPGCSFVAIHQDTIVGAVLSGHDGRRGYINHLGVAKAYRRTGIGSHLLSMVENQFKCCGIKKEALFVLKDNTLAQQFYTSIGWQEETIVKTYTKLI